ncbi:DNA mismatch repair protein PMS2 [Pancytospora philotis]|nr:DNA mismatch repair protein PMS2 [Pancytospora philotis]
MIEKIPKEMVKAIRSQQYIHSSYIIAKELIENALDANAQRIKIQLGDKITVEDDGDGILSLENLCMNGYTSKEETSYRVLGIDDSNAGFSHGFRGQALASIAELCDVEVTTRPRPAAPHTEDDKLGTRKNFRTGATERVARSHGTTVRVANLFHSCAIRRQINEKSRRKNVAQVLALVQGFAYLYATHFTVVDKGRVVLAVQGSGRPAEYAVAKHGHVHLEVLDEAFSFYLFPLCKDRTQIMALEKRVVGNSKILGTIAAIFRKFFDYPPTFLLLLTDEADVNVSVDKAEVVLKNFKYIKNKINEHMELYFNEQFFIHGTQLRRAQEAENVNGNSQLREAEPGKLVPVKPATIDANELVEHHCPEPLESGKEMANTEPSVYASDLVPAHATHNEGLCHPPHDQASTETAAVHAPADQLSTPEADKQAAVETTASAGAVLPASVSLSAYATMREEILEHPSLQVVKEDFRNMNIVGQFNQGFILCTLKKEDTTFLLTVDQHAADEIYNFERLQQTFSLKKQRLIAPIALDISPLQELVVEDNREVFERNGFVVEGKSLLTIPVYKNHFFTVTDFYSLLYNISDEVYESDRFKEIMASKACRSSVMIGTALDMREMRKVVDNLATLTRPWNCPHGRPTFKILTKL